jgi:hypothetical protein
MEVCHIKNCEILGVGIGAHMMRYEDRLAVPAWTIF